MGTTDFTIDQEDLKILFLHVEEAYQGYTFEKFVFVTKQAYVIYAKSKENPKTFSQWVNGQIIYLTMYI